MDKFLTIKKEWHSESCACELQIDWNIPLISKSKDANGFIVQDYSRTQTPNNVLNISQYEDIHYFEAWCVKQGTIIEADKGNLCDDMFCIGSSFNSFPSFRQSIDTQGGFEFNGAIYWIPQDSPLYSIVDSWSTTEVSQAAGLKSTYEFPELKALDPIFKRTPFQHSWNLIGENNIFLKAKQIAFRYCPRNSKRDRELLDSCVKELFGNKYPQLAKRIIEEWQLQWVIEAIKQEE